MQSLLVISDEPALAETLAGELPEYAITGARPGEAEHYVHDNGFRLIITDNDIGHLTALAPEKLVKLNRPIRLSEAIYTIYRQLKSKTISLWEEKEFLPGYLFFASDRTLRLAGGDNRITLTEKESEIITYIIENKGKVLSREVLLKAVWGYGEDINTHTLETHIYRLRAKLKQLDDTIDIVFSEEKGYAIKAG